LMLDRWVLKIEKRLVGHILFLPQEVVRCEVWISGLKRRHNYRWWFSQREMQSNTHPNEWVQYIS
jgi:hypothetical protein